MKRTHTLFLILLLLAFAVRLVWLLSTDNAGYGDAAARLNITQMWLYSYWQVPRVDYLKILNPSVDWLPLHFYLMGLVSYVCHDLVYAPRIFTMLISVLSLLPLYRLCLLKYNRTTALIATVILAFYGMHICLSGLILSESFYLFFILWCYYFIERYRTEDNDSKWLVLIGLCLFSCCLLRYEGWVFAPLVILIVPFLKKMRFKDFLILVSIPSIAVCFVMICEVMQGEHPLRGILYSDFEVRQSNHFLGAPDFENYLPSYLPLYAIAVIMILVETFKTKKRSELLVIALYLLPIFPFLIKFFNGTLTAQARYLVIYMVPGIVLIAHFIYLVSQRFKLRNVSLVLFMVVYVLISNISFARQVRDKNITLKYAPGFMHSAAYFRDSITQARAYIDYGAGLSSANWMVYADLYEAINSEAFIDSVAQKMHIDPTVFINRVKKGARYRINGHEYEWKTWSISGFADLLQKKEITYIVLFPDGLLSKALNFSNPHESYRNRTFTRLFSQDGYMIYRIEEN
jgi:hypothetical protein